MPEIHPLLAKLIEERKARGMTQTAIAKHIGISKTAICEMEAGHHEPKMRTFIGYAEALGHKVLPDSGPELVIFSWDYREQPDMAEFHRAVNDISGNRVHVIPVETGSDQYAVVVCDQPLGKAEAVEAYRDWWVNGE